MRTCQCCRLKLLLFAIMNDTAANSGALATSAEGPEPCSQMQSGFSLGLSVSQNSTLLPVWSAVCHSGLSAALQLLLILDDACCPKLHLTGKIKLPLQHVLCVTMQWSCDICSSSDGWRDLPVEQWLGLTTDTDRHGDFLSFND